MTGDVQCLYQKFLNLIIQSKEELMPYEIAQKLFGPEMNEGLKFLLFHAVVILPTAYTDLGKK